ncbi:helix-turn-helix domain-containing protein [Nitratireductor kimnyeongensis]|uniref:Helix-turn-helix domain-containing protein n=1 Tax=Nitratireductor kimnyeongensis TaxID=430679 RepID=A0ABW0T4W8_9HYPH|nr:helix-turn-helix transcriptional regulator [Nitratireductor kimnyeongensis]QZZ35034.1 helix-turn-helix transcriptional regulator [Nitratireductor kimnyeongensis]
MKTNITTAAKTNAGTLIREWRERRRMSQLHLALEAGISQRHLSFLERGRSNPSRDMVLLLSESLSIPLRQRNRILLASGYAPGFSERDLHDPDLKPAMEVVQAVLDGHAPNPAIAIDRHWTMVAANQAIAPLLEGVINADLLKPPVNVLRLSLHPEGLAPSIINLPAWRAHVLERLRHLIDQTADPQLTALEKELAAYPVEKTGPPPKTNPTDMIAVPLRLRLRTTELSFITTTTVFGTPLDVTLSELAIESFFPADPETAGFLRQVQSRGS